MSTSLPPLLGPIETGSAFMIASIQNGVPYILNGFTPSGQSVISYYWESNLSTINASTQMGVFTAQGTLDSLIIKDTINTGGIAFAANGVTIGNAALPANIKMSQPLYSNWFPPDIFLSSVIYTMYNSSNGATAQIHTTPNLNSPTIPANSIVIVPVLWYFNCTSSGSYDVINQPLNSVINWICLAATGTTGCSGLGLASGGWTNLSDCNVGSKYTYCPNGDICGTNNCKGPCSVIYDDCNFSSGNYVCVFNPEKFFADTKWWESPYFIGSVIGIIVIIAVLLFITIAIARHGQRTNNFPSMLSGRYESSNIYD